MRFGEKKTLFKTRDWLQFYAYLRVNCTEPNVAYFWVNMSGIQAENDLQILSSCTILQYY